MNKYTSHFSAACAWAVPYLHHVLSSELITDRLNGDIVDCTVLNPSDRRRNNYTTVHSCKLQLPRGAVVKRNGGYVSSPELVFLELACELDIHRLILLGLQLCAHSPGKVSEALSTKRRLTSFLEKTPRLRGNKKARRALKYVENGSGSIMESLLFMTLTLPHSYGGFGLTGASFNHQIPLNKESVKLLRQKHCYTDLYYAKKKIAIEYNSNQYHETPSARKKDAIRSAAIQQQGITIVHLNTNQLYDEFTFNEFVTHLAKNLKKRIRIRSKEYTTEYANLRNMYPSKYELENI